MDNSSRYLKLFGYDYVPYSFDCVKEFENLDELNKAIQSCSLCNLAIHSLAKNTNTKSAKIVFVVTSFKEQHSPFTILENESFNKIINFLKLSKDDYTILPILKCNSNISQAHLYVDSCKNYILNELLLIEPTLVITLGNSFDILFNKHYQDIIGSVVKYDRFMVVPLYDIGFVLKNPSLKHNMNSYLKKIKFLLDRL